jgi:hypothetical protein
MAEEGKYSFRKDDSNPMVLIGILIVLIVIFGAALIVIISGGDGEEYTIPDVDGTKVDDIVKDDQPKNDTNVTEVCDDLCYLDIAVKGQNLSACWEIVNRTVLQDCYESLSNVSLDACLSVEDEQKLEDCVTSFAQTDDDITLCDYLDGDARSDCQYELDPCLFDEDTKLCNALAEEDPEECFLNTDCLIKYSMGQDDEEACDLIQNPVISQACISAATSNDKCYTLGLKAEQDYCYQVYATYADSYVLCTEITGNSVYSLDCYSHFAAELNDLSLCDYGGFDLNNKWACYSNFSLLSGNISGCDGIHKLAVTNRFNCVFDFAKEYGDASACQVIESLPQRTTCYSAVVIYSPENLDWTKCGPVSDFNWRNKCYTEAAKTEDDVSICQNIDENFAMNACKDAYYGSKND